VRPALAEEEALMSEAVWYVAAGGKSYGPYTVEQIAKRVEKGQATGRTMVYGPGAGSWTPLSKVPAFAALFGAATAPPPPLPEGEGIADEIDFQIHGEEMQFVEIELDPAESAVAEAGAMMYMEPGIEMSTVFGDGRGQEGGFMDKLLGAGKRVLTGESIFITVFTNQGHGKQHVAFAAPYAGRILPMDLRQHGGTLVCQKDSFLCAAKGVTIGIAFQKKFGVGLFGGEGFIMQRLEGDGLVFVHAGGMVHPIDLEAGQNLRVDTGCIVALQPSVSYDIEFVGSVKTAFFGGEGLFYAALTGPGRVWLQSLPFSRLASRIYKAAPQTGGRRKGEGSVLDLVGGLGNLVDGD
jgi:uncharacterized protein (TIGR00266 family)